MLERGGWEETDSRVGVADNCMPCAHLPTGRSSLSSGSQPSKLVYMRVSSRSTWVRNAVATSQVECMMFIFTHPPPGTPWGPYVALDCRPGEPARASHTRHPTLRHSRSPATRPSMRTVTPRRSGRPSPNQPHSSPYSPSPRAHAAAPTRRTLRARLRRDHTPGNTARMLGRDHANPQPLRPATTAMAQPSRHASTLYTYTHIRTHAHVRLPPRRPPPADSARWLSAERQSCRPREAAQLMRALRPAEAAAQAIGAAPRRRPPGWAAVAAGGAAGAGVKVRGEVVGAAGV